MLNLNSNCRSALALKIARGGKSRDVSQWREPECYTHLSVRFELHIF